MLLADISGMFEDCPMRARFVSRKKEVVAWDYYTNGTYDETRYYKSWVYKRADGSEFLNLEYPQTVKRDYKNKPYTVRECWSDNCWQIVTTARKRSG